MNSVHVLCRYVHTCMYHVAEFFHGAGILFFPPLSTVNVTSWRQEEEIVSFFSSIHVLHVELCLPVGVGTTCR